MNYKELITKDYVFEKTAHKNFMKVGSIVKRVDNKQYCVLDGMYNSNDIVSFYFKDAIGGFGVHGKLMTRFFNSDNENICVYKQVRE